MKIGVDGVPDGGFRVRLRLDLSGKGAPVLAPLSATCVAGPVPAAFWALPGSVPAIAWLFLADDGSRPGSTWKGGRLSGFDPVLLAKAAGSGVIWVFRACRGSSSCLREGVMAGVRVSGSGAAATADATGGFDSGSALSGAGAAWAPCLPGFTGNSLAASAAGCIRPGSIWSGGRFCAAWDAAGNSQNRANASGVGRNLWNSPAICDNDCSRKGFFMFYNMATASVGAKRARIEAMLCARYYLARMFHKLTRALAGLLFRMEIFIQSGV